MQSRKVVIVGGGSAGWMSAALLSAQFKPLTKDRLEISLVESKEVPSIGVGEATVHTMRNFLQSADIIEGEFLAACDATLKHGILFKDWVRGSKPGRNDQYFHAFENPELSLQHSLADHWINAVFKTKAVERFDRWYGIQSLLAAAGRSPKSLEDEMYHSVVPYGYHLDANKFAHFLKDLCVARGVVHQIGHVKDIELSETGEISQLRLNDGEIIKGDIFVDCTGFAGTLMEAVKVPWQDAADSLFVDKAVTARAPHAELNTPLRPYTTAIARDAGWTFDIDLRNRTGRGYVYSSAHVDPAQAESDFRGFYKLSDNVEVNHIAMRTGRRDCFWCKNVVAIGMSASFLEPLESTGLYLVERGLDYLVTYIVPGASERTRNRINKKFSELFDEVKRFIVLHYVLTKRDDTTFWQAVKTKTAIDDALLDRIAHYRVELPSDLDFDTNSTFGETNYAQVVFGMDCLPDALPARLEGLSDKESMRVFSEFTDIQKNFIDQMPSHNDFLKKYVSSFG